MLLVPPQPQSAFEDQIEGKSDDGTLIDSDDHLFETDGEDCPWWSDEEMQSDDDDQPRIIMAMNLQIHDNRPAVVLHRSVGYGASNLLRSRLHTVWICDICAWSNDITWERCSLCMTDRPKSNLQIFHFVDEPKPYIHPAVHADLRGITLHPQNRRMPKISMV